MNGIASFFPLLLILAACAVVYAYERGQVEWHEVHSQTVDGRKSSAGRSLQGAEGAAGMNEWMSVADNPPEFDRRVIVLIENRVAIATRWKKWGWRFNMSLGRTHQDGVPTHWMPLPNGPDGEILR